MVSLNYQAYGKRKFGLRLRIYENGETRFISVTSMLIGDLTFSDWNKKRGKFRRSAPYCDENNTFLDEFIRKYEKLSVGWKGSIDSFAHYFDDENGRIHYNKPAQTIPVNTVNGKTFDWMVKYIVCKMKRNNVNTDGTVSEGYTMYEKMAKRVAEYCEHKKIDYAGLMLEGVDANFINGLFDYVKNKKTGRCVYVSQGLHATLSMATKFGLYNINKVAMCDWIKKNGRGTKKYHTLTDEQCRKLANMSAEELPPGPHSELYRDFCVFLLFTCQSPCDAVSLKYSDIQNINGMDHFVFKRRKIASRQSIDCSVPINDVMRKIMDKWKSKAKNGYVFPIRNAERMKHIVENSDIKHFVQKLNIWLKKMGAILGCKFPLHSYAFRHTGITRYVSKNIPVTYIANLAGTSVSNVETIYYNNQGDTTSRDMVLNAVNF